MGHRIGEAKHSARDAAENADQAGDDELTPQVGVKHLSDAAPDLVEVGAVVVRHETPEDPSKRRGVESQEESHDEREQELEERGQRCQTNSPSTDRYRSPVS